ncbi:Hypothetical protein PBC10988_19210 [Planctomycetales bacterium 10988]|nr:Hypothetical protein PBC10988_19210 [Planctomycetales bacterium 10988]
MNLDVGVVRLAKKLFEEHSESKITDLIRFFQNCLYAPRMMGKTAAQQSNYLKMKVEKRFTKLANFLSDRQMSDLVRILDYYNRLEDDPIKTMKFGSEATQNEELEREVQRHMDWIVGSEALAK